MAKLSGIWRACPPRDSESCRALEEWDLREEEEDFEDDLVVLEEEDCWTLEDWLDCFIFDCEDEVEAFCMLEELLL